MSDAVIYYNIDNPEIIKLIRATDKLVLLSGSNQFFNRKADVGIFIKNMHFATRTARAVYNGAKRIGYDIERFKKENNLYTTIIDVTERYSDLEIKNALIDLQGKSDDTWDTILFFSEIETLEIKGLNDGMRFQCEDRIESPEKLLMSYLPLQCKNIMVMTNTNAKIAYHGDNVLAAVLTMLLCEEEWFVMYYGIKEQASAKKTLPIPVRKNFTIKTIKGDEYSNDVNFDEIEL